MVVNVSPFCRKLRESPAYGPLVEALGPPVLGYTSAEWTSNPFGYPDVRVWVEMCDVWCTPKVVAVQELGSDQKQRSPEFKDLETVLVWLKVEGWI